jgi:hypothetical protein
MSLTTLILIAPVARVLWMHLLPGRQGGCCGHRSHSTSQTPGEHDG